LITKKAPSNAVISTKVVKKLCFTTKKLRRKMVMLKLGTLGLMVKQIDKLMKNL
jgi:hypothetical protein